MSDSIVHWIIDRSRDNQVTWQALSSNWPVNEPPFPQVYNDPGAEGDPATAVDRTVYYRIRGITAAGNTVPYDIGHISHINQSDGGRCLRGVQTYGDANVSNKGAKLAPNGNFHVLYQLQETENFGTPSSPISLTSGDGCGVIVSYAPTGVVNWAKQTAHAFAPAAIAVDSSNNTIVVGQQAGAAPISWGNDVNGNPVTVTTQTDQFGNRWGDIVVAKYNSSGGLLWAKLFGGTQQDASTAVCCDSSGNIYFTGSIAAAVTFDSITLNGVGVPVVKLNSSGVTQWAKLWTGSSPARARGIALNSFGELFITGLTSSDFNPGGGVTPGSRMYLAIYSAADGTFGGWQKTFPGSGEAVACDMRADTAIPEAGSVVLTGTQGGNTDFGTGTIGPGGLFLASFNRSGTCLRARCFNSQADGTYSSSDSGYAVSVDTNGDIVFSGQVASPVVFGAQALYGPFTFFVAKFSSSLGYHWAIRGGETGQGISQGVVFAGTNIYVAGSILGRVGIGSGVVLDSFEGASNFSSSGFVGTYIKG